MALNQLLIVNRGVIIAYIIDKCIKVNYNPSYKPRARILPIMPIY